MVESKLTNKVSRESMSRYFKLMHDASWLSGKHDQLAELHELCADDDQLDVITFLLDKMFIAEGDKIKNALNWMAEKIATNKLNDPNSHRIVAQDFNARPGSSHVIFEMLRIKFEAWPDWMGSKIFEYDLKSVLADDSVKSISLIDDFIGSGQKVKSLLKYVESKRPNLEVDILSCVAMEEACNMKFISGVFRSINTHHCMKKGITGELTEPERTKMLSAMLALERSHGTINSHMSLGHKQTEANYGTPNWSIPDNTFPIFWIPRADSSSALFTRARK